MKITNLMSMLAAATAVGFCMSATAGDGQSGKLELTDPVTHVNVTAESDTAVGGNWNIPPTVVGEVGQKYFEIDTDGASTNQFTATGDGITTGKVVTCQFVLKPSPVSCTGTPPAPDGEAQVAFCIATNTSTGASSFQAYVNGGWQQLRGPEVPTGSGDYTLKITLDYSGSTKYAKFAIGETVLTNNSNQVWLQTANSTNCVTEYCFVGSGSLKSILTTGQDITAEEATVGGHDVVIPEEAIQELGGNEAAATALAETQSNGKTMLENYVIFGQKALTETITANTKPVAKISTKTDGFGNIPLNFQNLDVKNVPGTSVSYQLMGAASSAGPFTEVGAAVSDAAEVKIPSGTPYKVFKVQVNVNYDPAN